MIIKLKCQGGVTMKEKISYISLSLLLAIIIIIGTSAWGEEDGKSSLRERFHSETSLTWSGALADLLRAKPKLPPRYKNYPGAKEISLPKPDYRGIVLEDAIKKRRSVREYSSRPLGLNQVSQILFAAQGITGSLHGRSVRTTPSAGALYPFEVYAIVNNVEGLQKGIYHYSVINHALELIKPGDFRSDITSAGLKQEMLGDSGVTIVLTAIFDRTRHKYGERGVRYIYMEGGHISQNISLQAVSLGLGSVPVGAFLDKKINNLIGVDGKKEAAIYLHSVGWI
jgi:SagB-type dehydrogenase family enzyme